MILQLVLTLSHGQATINRGFRANKTILKENKDRESMICHCYIKDYMNANNLIPHEVKITDPMISSVKSARKEYEQHLEDLQVSKEDESLIKQKAILEHELKEVAVKKDQVERTFKILDEESIANVENVEKENYMTYVSKASGLKRKSNEKKSEFKKLEEVIGIL